MGRSFKRFSKESRIELKLTSLTRFPLIPNRIYLEKLFITDYKNSHGYVFWTKQTASEIHNNKFNVKINLNKNTFFVEYIHW